MRDLGVAFPTMTSRLPSAGARRGVIGLLLVCAGFALLGLGPLRDVGVYTKEQAERGRVLYGGACAVCHGAELEGTTSTPLAGKEFIASWAKPNLTLDDFYYIVRKTMPKEKGGSLTSEAYTDVVAFILQQNGFPAGEKALTPNPELMKTIRFTSPVPPALRSAPLAPR